MGNDRGYICEEKNGKTHLIAYNEDIGNEEGFSKGISDTSLCGINRSKLKIFTDENVHNFSALLESGLSIVKELCEKCKKTVTEQ